MDKNEIVELLDEYFCSQSFDYDGNALPLADVLTPEGETTVDIGNKEIESLAEYLYENWVCVHQKYVEGGKHVKKTMAVDQGQHTD